MGLAILGVARSGMLTGPATSYRALQDLRALALLASARMVLLASDLDPFLFPGQRDGTCLAGAEVLDYVETFLELEIEDGSLEDAAITGHGRLRVIRMIEREMEGGAGIPFYPETNRSRPWGPYVLGLEALVNVPDSDGSWSPGEVADIAAMLETLVGFHAKRGDQVSREIVDLFSPWASDFGALREAGAYAIRC